MAKRKRKSRRKLRRKLTAAARWDTSGLLGRILEGIAIGLTVAVIQKLLNL